MLRIVLALAASVSLLASGTRAETLHISTGEYAPFTDSTAPDHGVINSVVLRIAAAAGYDVEFDYMPWKRGLELARAGRHVATSFWYYSVEREADFIHVGPIIEDRLAFFYVDRADVTDWNALPDLSGQRIGAVTGYTFTEEFWQMGDEGVLDIHLAPDDLANLRKLLGGRIDLYPISEDAGWHIIHQNFSAEEAARFRTLARPLSVSEAYLLVSRAALDGEEVARALKAALAEDRAAQATPTDLVQN